MDQWSRASIGCLCGYCGATLQKDAPIRITTIIGVKRNRIRGQCCAGPAPPELGPIQTRKHVETTMQSIQAGAPTRTRGGLKQAVEKWMPYRD